MASILRVAATLCVALGLLMSPQLSTTPGVTAQSSPLTPAYEELDAFPAFEEIDGLQVVVAKRWLYLDQREEFALTLLPGVVLWQFSSAETAADAFDLIMPLAPQFWLVCTFSPSYETLMGMDARSGAQFVIDPRENPTDVDGIEATAWEFGLRVLPSGRAEPDRVSEVIMVQRDNVLILAGVSTESWMLREQFPAWYFEVADDLADSVILDATGAAVSSLPDEGQGEGELIEDDTLVLYRNDVTTAPASTMIVSDSASPTPTEDISNEATPDASPASATPDPGEEDA